MIGYLERFLRWSIICLLAFSIYSPTAWAQSWRYHFVQSNNVLQDRNAYLLTLLESFPAARAAVTRDTVLQNLGSRLKKIRNTVFAACENTTSCPVGDMMLSQTEITQTGDELAALAKTGGPLTPLVEDQMRPSGRFQKYATLDDAGLMRAAWIETANGVNRLYRVYALGEKFPSIAIDGPDKMAAETDLQNDIGAALSSEIDGDSGEVFFSPWSRLGFDLLIINQRTEAGLYEPLETGKNAAAFGRARSLNWSAWRYTAILAPGIGLNPGEIGVSPMGTFIVRMVARRWHEGLAPFIIVSGGHVHPNRTPYSEAVEMKRLLLTQYHIPENAVVIDPYARHTTTNLRNAVRLLFRMGAPMDKPFLVTSVADTSQYIGSQSLADRCLHVLGYHPVEILSRTSPFDLIARPNILSLQADMQDPLDP